MTWISAIKISVLFTIWTRGISSEVNVIARKYETISRESRLAGEAIKEIPDSMPGLKELVVSMASDLIEAHYAVSSLGSMVPNSSSNKSEQELSFGSNLFSGYLIDIQQAIHNEDYVELKRRLVNTAINLGDNVAEHAKELKLVKDDAPNRRLKKILDGVMLVLYKVRYQAMYVEKTISELGPELAKSFEALTGTLNSLSDYDKTIGEEFSAALKYFSTTSERAGFRLENWLRANPNNAKNQELVQQILNNLGKITQKADEGLLENNVQHLKENLLNICKTGSLIAEIGSQLEAPDNSTDKEKLRSALVDAITIARVYAENL